MPKRSKRWVWSGRLAALAVLVAVAIWLWSVGLTQASALAGALGLLVALAALFAPYLFPVQPPRPVEGVVVENSGGASANNGGEANSGVRGAIPSGNVRVDRSGDAEADGSGSVANTGIQDSSP